MSAQPPTLAPSLPARTEPAALPLRSVCTENFPALLRELGASVMVTTGQAGKLVILRADNGAINTHFRGFNSPTASRSRETASPSAPRWRSGSSTTPPP